MYLAISGTHLISEYGQTIKNIKKYKKKFFKVNIIKRITRDGISESISNGIKKISKILHQNKFDALIVCGDRYELLAPCIAATFHKVPVIHFHGGEITLGAYDDTVRHAISKMSSLHFVSHQNYKKRVKQLGENQVKFIVLEQLEITKIFLKKYIQKKRLKIN